MADEITQKGKKIEYIGLDKIDPAYFDMGAIQDTVDRHMQKIGPVLRQQDTHLKVHIKEQSSGAEKGKHRFTVKMHLTYPGKNISIDNVEGLDLNAAVQKAMQELENRVMHIFRE
jgi:ribosome-associated translation inhibitor RaiA